MELIIFNGSPRGEKSNTGVVLEEFAAGFDSVAGNSHKLEHLKPVNDHARLAEMFGKAEAVLLAFPLYVDAMPAQVKAFIEQLAPLAADKSGSRPLLLCLVQSGFPEAAHSRRVERYLEKLARRLGCPYGGTMVKGGVEGIRMKPPWMVKGVKLAYRELGENFGRTGELDAALLAKLARPERLSFGMRLLLRVFALLGLVNAPWNMMLKKHHAFDKRFAKPFGPSAQ